MVRINGKDCDVAGQNLGDYLKAEFGHLLGGIAVELNGEILSESRYQQITLKDGDNLEVLIFVGGG